MKLEVKGDSSLGYVVVYLMCVAVWATVWMAGVVLAKGFWSTFFAVITGGLYSYYLIIERVIT